MRSGRAAPASLATVVAACLAVIVGTGAPDALARPAAGPADTPQFAPTMLVLDASGSMAERDAGGTRMDAAKRAVAALVDASPAEAEVGLTVYGTGTGSSDAEKEAGCQDVRVLKQPGVIDKAGIKAAVAGLGPRGYTPIGKALQTAAGALPTEGPRSVVLVSDGIDTCAPPDPCEVVRSLSGQGVELVVHTVGFGVDEQARAQLQCVAHTTGGTYTDAPDAQTLERALPRVTATAMRNYEPSGIPIAGTENLLEAPPVQPGQYLDTLEKGARKHYTLDAPEGSTIYFSATVSFPRVETESGAQSVRVTMLGRDGSDCFSADRDVSLHTEDGGVLTSQARWDTTSNEWGEECSGPGRYTFRVERAGTPGGHEGRLPLELLAGVEPPVQDVATLPAPAEQASSHVDSTGPVRPVVGGGTFGTAATLDGPGRYGDHLRFGEFVFYRVKVEWGQALTARIRYDTIPDEQLDSPFPHCMAVVYSPFRHPVGWAARTHTGAGFTLPTSASKDEFGKPVPVEYRNRESTTNEVAAQSIAGDYYIGVKVGQNTAGAPAPVPVVLDVALTGRPHGGPTYEAVAAPGERGAVFGPSPRESAEAAHEEENPLLRVQNLASTTLYVVGGVAALGVLVLAGIGLTTLRRRRR